MKIQNPFRIGLLGGLGVIVAVAIGATIGSLATIITYVGAAFLCFIAVIPTAISSWLKIPLQITAFLGGTGLLIVVSVALDMVQRIEANLLMRNYGGFLGSGGKGKRIKGRQY